MISEAEFFAGITGSENDLARMVRALRGTGTPFCLIADLAVNYYVEPVITLEADFTITASDGVLTALEGAGFVVEAFPHSMNATQPGSRLRIQITINNHDGSFPSRAIEGVVFGVPVPVASLPDVVQGKLWAATNTSRRSSKRAKDKADLVRICESHPQVLSLIPPGTFARIDELRGR